MKTIDVQGIILNDWEYKGTPGWELQAYLIKEAEPEKKEEYRQAWIDYFPTALAELDAEYHDLFLVISKIADLHTEEFNRELAHILQVTELPVDRQFIRLIYLRELINIDASLFSWQWIAENFEQFKVSRPWEMNDIYQHYEPSAAFAEIESLLKQGEKQWKNLLLRLPHMKKIHSKDLFKDYIKIWAPYFPERIRETWKHLLDF